MQRYHVGAEAGQRIYSGLAADAATHEVVFCEEVLVGTRPCVGDGVAEEHRYGRCLQCRIITCITLIIGKIGGRMSGGGEDAPVDSLALADEFHLHVAQRLVALGVEMEMVALGEFFEVAFIERRQGKQVEERHAGGAAADHLLGHKLVHAALRALIIDVGAASRRNEALGGGHEQNARLGGLLANLLEGVVDAAALGLELALVISVIFGIVPGVAREGVDLVEIVGRGPQDVGVIDRSVGSAGLVYLPLDVLPVPLGLVGKTGAADAVFGNLCVQLRCPIVGSDVGGGNHAERPAEQGDGLLVVILGIAGRQKCHGR